jgi:hypothetical protein
MLAFLGFAGEGGSGDDPAGVGIIFFVFFI